MDTTARKTGTVLDGIVEAKARRLEALRAEVPPREMLVRARRADASRPFRKALDGADRIAVIAEIKTASPSRGVLQSGLDVSGLARAYERGGAAAVSVVTEEDFFLGAPDRVARVHNAIRLPVLRKDFLFDPYQVAESRALGADAVLLIVALLDEHALRDMLEAVGALGMDALVEIHDEEELERALQAGAGIVGVNNRDLETMTVDGGTAEALAPRVPDSACFVVESGLRDAKDVARAAGYGADAVLVGEALVIAPDPARKAREMMPAREGEREEGRP